jgi:hypothetical protein
MKTIHVEIVADIGETVFLKTDDEQKPRIITEILLRPSGSVLYLLVNGASGSWHNGFEISQVINVLAKT